MASLAGTSAASNLVSRDQIFGLMLFSFGLARSDVQFKTIDYFSLSSGAYLK